MTRFRYLLCAPLAAVAAALIGWGGGRPPDILFERQMIDPGASETVAVADINGDGKPDIVSGENWYEAPKWIKHKFRDLDFTNNYVDNFSDLPLDVNGDGRIDIVSFSYFGKRVYWSENPGKAGGLWKDHTIDSGFPRSSPSWWTWITTARRARFCPSSTTPKRR